MVSIQKHHSEKMDNKLEIHHIYQYGSNLTVIYDDIICNVEGYDFLNKDTVIIERVNVKLVDIKPLLIPINKIYQSINYKNVEIIPILEIIKAYKIKINPYRYTLGTNSIDTYLDESYCKGIKGKQRKARIWIDKDYALCISIEGYTHKYLHNISGINKIHELCIDYQDLIGKKLAVDLTEI